MSDALEAEQPLERGARVGRYFILEELGAGGMGVVYAAYDPRLGRKVALKLLRRQGSEALDEEFRARLLREAQAMAQLSHPNVLAVHDVGTHQGSTFLAMDCLEGGTLASWLAASPRSWREIRDRFLAAGRGLAAAHRAGIIHRDFKPDNVLLGSDGAIRVTDFGLARGTDELSEGVAVTPARGVLTSSLTVAGALVGTPAYMSPEQIESRPSDARADQFSFCASLYEALYGALPYPGGEVKEILESVRARAVRPPPRDRKVPGWLRAVLLRGLSEAPQDRYPTMEALLQALDADPEAKLRRRALRLAAALGVLGFAAFAWDLRRRAGERCSGGELRFAEVWTDELRRSGAAAFAATGLPYAEDAWGRAAGALDAFRDGWLRLHREACEATQVRREQSAQLLDLKNRCLDERLEGARALTALLASADVATVKSVEQLIAPLSEVRQCGDASYVSARVKPPPPALEADVRAARGELEAALALMRAGRPQEGWTRLQQATPTVRTVPYPPLQAQLALATGQLAHALGKHAEAGEGYRAAAAAAEAAREDETSARALVGLVNQLYDAELPPEVAFRISEVARGAIARVPASEALEASRLERTARLLRREKRFEEALAANERALALARRGAPDPGLEARLLRELGSSLRDAGQHARALEVTRQALTAIERLGGPRHPEVANTLATAGNLALSVADPKAALGYHQRASELIAAVYGREHAFFGNTLVGIQYAHTEQDAFGASLAVNDQELALRRRLGQERDVSFARALVNRSGPLIELGRPAEAAAGLREAIAIYDGRFGEGHASSYTAREALALALSANGQHAEARALAARLVVERRKSLGEVHPELAGAIAVQAHVELAGGAARRAVELARQVIALHQQLPPDNLQRALDGEELGMALLAAGDREEGGRVLRAALDCCGLRASRPVHTARIHLALASVSTGAEAEGHCRTGLELLAQAGLEAERAAAGRRCKLNDR